MPPTNNELPIVIETEAKTRVTFTLPNPPPGLGTPNLSPEDIWASR